MSAQSLVVDKINLVLFVFINDFNYCGTLIFRLANTLV